MGQLSYEDRLAALHQWGPLPLWRSDWGTPKPSSHARQLHQVCHHVDFIWWTAVQEVPSSLWPAPVIRQVGWLVYCIILSLTCSCHSSGLLLHYPPSTPLFCLLCMQITASHVSLPHFIVLDLACMYYMIPGFARSRQSAWDAILEDNILHCLLN